MQIRLLLGPAGSGKTYRCLREVRQALSETADGPPLLFLAPKQATYQLERQILFEPGLPGYTRLRILSFERLAEFIFEQLGAPQPEMLDEEGRVMVLRGLISRKRSELKLFRASSRLTGFAQQLSAVLSEFQRDQLTPESLCEIAARVRDTTGLALKLQDLAILLQDYLAWLEGHHLRDIDSLLLAATDLLHDRSPAISAWLDAVWLDGFAEFSRQELALLCVLLPGCRHATLAFCLDRLPEAKPSWLSTWSVVQRSYELCRGQLAGIPGAEIVTDVLPRRPDGNRFEDNPVLQHIERFWCAPRAYAEDAVAEKKPKRHSNDHSRVASQPFFPGFDSLSSLASEQKPKPDNCLRVAACIDPEAEAVLAAREILAHVRAGGRYRDAAVLVRNLEPYQQVLQRVFGRYEIPCFLDRRELVAHHPLAELTRSALRTVALRWQQEDFFAALKTGLVPAQDAEVDRLENEALARGWQGTAWQRPLIVKDDPELTERIAEIQRRVVPPFHHLALALALAKNEPTGGQLAAALRNFWSELEVEKQLENWASAEMVDSNSRRPASVHATVWDQMNGWADNIERAFPNEALALRDWLPILEAGLGTLSVGVIPPALDQVLIGAIDRSRNPDLKLAIVLGMNEGVFPARPTMPALLTDADRLELEKQHVLLGSGSRNHIGRERYFAYIACTRARQRLVLSYSLRSLHGTPLNVSPFVAHIRQLFPALEVETVPAELPWQQCEHVSELVPVVVNSPGATTVLSKLAPVAAMLERLKRFQEQDAADSSLAPGWAARLYGPVLRTSVSRLEQFAACPFKFFVHSGLRAEERKLFELDAKEQGTFQHEVLALFHEQVRAEGKRWRDLSPAEARERVAAIGRNLLAGYREGLLQASDQTRFLATSMTESLQDFVATLVGWMREQYRFDPVAVELGYGEGAVPPWSLDLGEGHRLDLRGRIDRVDLFKLDQAEEALCVVLDYKSSRKQLDPLMLEHGLQLQLLAYLNVLRRWPQPAALFGANRLVPVGVFYVNLRGRPGRESNRRAALADPVQARKLACRHSGRFDISALHQLDSRPDATEGDQFNYRLKKDGEIRKGSAEAVDTAKFHELLDSVEQHLKDMGRRIYAGDTQVSPFRKSTLIACDQCDYHAICRIDPWTHRYRTLRPAVAAAGGSDALKA